MAGIKLSGPPVSSRPQNHYIQLDGLRAFAALSVILQHFSIPGLPMPLPVGLAGVWLFFVLSGFLITGILLRARSDARGDRSALAYAWRAFYIRRILRIFPLYYTVLIGAACLGLPLVRYGFGWYAGHLTNFFGALVGPVAPSLVHFWSLAVEEQFYLVWPSLILLAPRRFVMGTTIAMIVVAPISRFLMIRATGDWAFSHALPPSCLDGLAMGALLALLREEGTFSPEARGRYCRSALAVGLLILVAIKACELIKIGYRIPFSIRYTGYSLVSLWLVDRAVDGFRGPAKWVLEARPLVYMGKISYGIYVFHMIVPELVDWVRDRYGYGLGLSEEAGLARSLYVTGASVLLATISWNLIEKPLNDLKRFFPYKRPKARPSFEAGGRPIAVDGVNAGSSFGQVSTHSAADQRS